MNRMTILAALSILIIGCCPFTAISQMVSEQMKNALPDTIGDEDPFTVNVNPCEGIYEKYPHDPALGEIPADYVGCWHASESVSARYNERFVLFASGHYLFFPDEYECAYTFNTCVPSPIEDGLWGVQSQVMNFAIGGDMNNLISRSITPVIPTEDEFSYPFTTTIDGLTFWLLSKETDMWDPETGGLCW